MGYIQFECVPIPTVLEHIGVQSGGGGGAVRCTYNFEIPCRKKLKSAMSPSDKDKKCFTLSNTPGMMSKVCGGYFH